jgi:hypothetical protein
LKRLTPPGAHSAAGIVGVDPKTVRRYVEARDEGQPVAGPAKRPRLIDPFLAKIEEWVDRSEGKVRADVVHERLAGLGFIGDERTIRRAVAGAKERWRAGRRRRYRPWITEPDRHGLPAPSTSSSASGAGHPNRSRRSAVSWLDR